MDKKGFTLVELLAVIAILAVIMLIAATAVLPMMNKSRKNSLYDEGLALEKAGKLAYKDSSLTYTSGGKTYPIDISEGVCFDLEFLNKKGYYEKGNSDNYYGSVLIELADEDGEAIETSYSISNLNYKCSLMDKDSSVNDCEKGSNSDKTDDEIIKCDNESGIVYCNKNGVCSKN